VAVDDIGADLVVVAARKAGMKEFSSAMTTARVVRQANCSVLVVRNEQ